MDPPKKVVNLKASQGKLIKRMFETDAHKLLDLGRCARQTMRKDPRTRSLNNKGRLSCIQIMR